MKKTSLFEYLNDTVCLSNDNKKIDSFSNISKYQLVNSLCFEFNVDSILDISSNDIINYIKKDTLFRTIFLTKVIKNPNIPKSFMKTILKTLAYKEMRNINSILLEQDYINLNKLSKKSTNTILENDLLLSHIVKNKNIEKSSLFKQIIHVNFASSLSTNVSLNLISNTNIEDKHLKYIMNRNNFIIIKHSLNNRFSEDYLFSLFDKYYMYSKDIKSLIDTYSHIDNSTLEHFSWSAESILSNLELLHFIPKSKISIVISLLDNKSILSNKEELFQQLFNNESLDSEYFITLFDFTLKHYGLIDYKTVFQYLKISKFKSNILDSNFKEYLLSKFNIETLSPIFFDLSHEIKEKHLFKIKTFHDLDAYYSYFFAISSVDYFDFNLSSLLITNNDILHFLNTYKNIDELVLQDLLKNLNPNTSFELNVDAFLFRNIKDPLTFQLLLDLGLKNINSTLIKLKSTPDNILLSLVDVEDNNLIFQNINSSKIKDILKKTAFIL